MADIGWPDGDPNVDWTHEQIDAWAAEYGFGPYDGTKPEKIAQIAEDTAGSQTQVAPPEPEPAPIDDIYSTGGMIPSGARGITVERLQAKLSVPVTRVLDRRTTNAVRGAQRAAGLPQTGVLDERTRKVIGI